MAAASILMSDAAIGDAHAAGPSDLATASETEAERGLVGAASTEGHGYEEGLSWQSLVEPLQLLVEPDLQGHVCAYYSIVCWNNDGWRERGIDFDQRCSSRNGFQVISG